MNIQDYTAAARRFDNHQPDSIIDALVHGLASEASEALQACFGRDTNAFFDELGDVQWYLALLAHEYSIDVPVLEEAECERCPANVPIISSLAIALAAEAGKLSGLVEKCHRRNPKVTVAEIQAAIVLIWQRLTWLAWLCGWPMTQVRQGNVDKLSARYGRAA